MMDKLTWVDFESEGVEFSFEKRDGQWVYMTGELMYLSSREAEFVREVFEFLEEVQEVVDSEE